MKRLIFLAFIVLLFSACSANSENTTKHTLYFYENGESNKIVSKEITFPKDTPENTVHAVFSKLSGPDNENLFPILPHNIKLESVVISDNTCHLTLSKNYSKLSPVPKAAVNACISKSLDGFSEFDKISVSCGGISETLYASSFITETPDIHYSARTVNLYFANSAFTSLVCESKTIFLDPNESAEYRVVSELIKGPSVPSGKKAIPDGTVLNSVYVNEGICFIDLSEHFVSNAVHLQQNEEIIIYSIVNSITELPMIDSVKFLIDGNDGYGYVYFDISKPLTNDTNFADNTKNNNPNGD